MIRERLTVHCDKCLEGHEDDPAKLDKLAFRKSKLTKYPIFFDSHRQLLRSVGKAGWYIDAERVLCPDHAQEYIDAYHAS